MTLAGTIHVVRLCELVASQTNMLHNSQRLTITLFYTVSCCFVVHCPHFYAFTFSLENRFMVTTKFSFWKIFSSYKAGTRLARSTRCVCVALISKEISQNLSRTSSCHIWLLNEKIKTRNYILHKDGQIYFRPFPTYSQYNAKKKKHKNKIVNL